MRRLEEQGAQGQDGTQDGSSGQETVQEGSTDTGVPEEGGLPEEGAQDESPGQTEEPASGADTGRRIVIDSGTIEPVSIEPIEPVQDDRPKAQEH